MCQYLAALMRDAREVLTGLQPNDVQNVAPMAPIVASTGRISASRSGSSARGEERFARWIGGDDWPLGEPRDADVRQVGGIPETGPPPAAVITAIFGP